MIEVKSDKPPHTFHKEFGSLINGHFGLYAGTTDYAILTSKAVGNVCIWWWFGPF